MTYVENERTIIQHAAHLGLIKQAVSDTSEYSPENRNQMFEIIEDQIAEIEFILREDADVE